MSKILEFLYVFKHRPKLYVSEDLDSVKLKIYLLGFINGLDFLSKADLSKQLFHWIRKRTIDDYDITWEAMIFDYHKGKSDEELKAILIETLEDFFKENPDWEEK